MNKLNLAAIALCTGITFACSPKASMVKGVICDATINTLTVVSEEGDTLSFSTLDAERVVTDGILLDDTAIVYHSGKYKTGMKAQKIVVVPGRRNMVGGDRDKHGCIGSAGYQWSEVQQDCIRVFEKGIRMKAVDGSQSAFIVFSPDSTQVELFFSSGDKNEILDRRSLPSGGYAWNVEDDDTKNVRRINGKWTINYLFAGRVPKQVKTSIGELPEYRSTLLFCQSVLCISNNVLNAQSFPPKRRSNASRLTTFPAYTSRTGQAYAGGVTWD